MPNQPKDKEWGDRFDEELSLIKVKTCYGKNVALLHTAVLAPEYSQKLKDFISTELTTLAQAFFDAVKETECGKCGDDNFRRCHEMTLEALKKIALDYQLEIE